VRATVCCFSLFLQEKNSERPRNSLRRWVFPRRAPYFAAKEQQMRALASPRSIAPDYLILPQCGGFRVGVGVVGFDSRGRPTNRTAWRLVFRRISVPNSPVVGL
jgi:hypothetical protein